MACATRKSAAAHNDPARFMALRGRAWDEVLQRSIGIIRQVG
ncbi:MAG TPA: hypothetical protein VIA64_16480 [Burkholderiales bacterium]|jgi:hypothetical protein